MDKNWTRWIIASLYKHFQDNKETLNVYFEGQKRTEVQESQDYIEIRVFGPIFFPNTLHQWDIFVKIDVLIQSKTNQADLYKIQRDMGIIAAAFKKSIPVYKYGDGGELLECLTLDDDSIQTQNYGLVDTDVDLQQATVEGQYKMTLLGT